MKPSEFADDEHTNSLYFPSNPMNVLEMQKSFPSVLLNRVYQFSTKMHSKLSRRRSAKQKRHQVTKIQKENQFLSPKESLGNKEGTFWHPKKVNNSKKTLLLPSLTICLDEEQFVFVPTSVYNNKTLNTQTVTKQELPKYSAEQNSTYQTASLKEEINKKLSTKADSSFDKVLSCPCINLSNSQTLIMDGGVSLTDFTQQLSWKYHRFQTPILPYLTRLVNLPF